MYAISVSGRCQRMALAAGVVAGLCAALAFGPACAEDRHEYYYYPEITSREAYEARARPQPGLGREARLAFVVGQTVVQQARPYPPRYALFAKGDEAEKLIIVGLHGDSFRTLYRARAVLAQLTAAARGTELFRNLEVEDYFTFFDLCRLLGFQQITVSDGENYAHQIALE